MFDPVYVRQAELLVRCLPEIGKQSCFALEGGTAINLFLRSMPRLSVDIDLTYVPLSGCDEALADITRAFGPRAPPNRRAILPETHGALPPRAAGGAGPTQNCPRSAHFNISSAPRGGDSIRTTARPGSARNEIPLKNPEKTVREAAYPPRNRRFRPLLRREGRPPRRPLWVVHRNQNRD